MKSMKIIIPICFLLSLTMVTLFIITAIRSRHEIPATLLDIYGDTSGIHELVIEGTVGSMSNRYDYSFIISPDNKKNKMRVYNSSNSNSQILYSVYRSWMSQPVAFDFRAIYIPTDEINSEIAESSVNSSRGPIMEYRIYSEIFEVIPCIQSTKVPLKLDPSKDKLYFDAGENGYISALIYNDTYDEHDFTPRFQVDLGPLPNTITMNDKHIIVPIGPGLFGYTAVYVVDAPDGDISTDNSAYVEAEELYPIELVRGKDEILGLIELENDFILMMKRGSSFELVRINPETREFVSETAQGIPDLINHFLSSDSLVFINNGNTQTWAFNLRDSGLRLVTMAEHNSMLDTIFSEYKYYEVTDSILKNDILYMSIASYMSTTSFMSTEAHIVAFDENGELIGQCKIICGIRENYLYNGNSLFSLKIS